MLAHIHMALLRCITLMWYCYVIDRNLISHGNGVFPYGMAYVDTDLPVLEIATLLALGSNLKPHATTDADPPISEIHISHKLGVLP